MDLLGKSHMNNYAFGVLNNFKLWWRKRKSNLCDMSSVDCDGWHLET